MVDANQISDAEWQVMEVVWQHEPVDSAAVVEALSARQEWSPATIKTMLHRLVKKGVLSFQQDGKRYLYTAKLRQSKGIRQASQAFLQRVFGGQAAPALQHFVQHASLTADEIAELRRIIDHKEREHE